MIVIMGQMDAASRIFDYLYLGTEWNASNWEELEANKCVRLSFNKTLLTRQCLFFSPSYPSAVATLST